MPSPKFGLIAEGATDHAVLSNILAGVFDDPDLITRPLQPLTDATAKGSLESFEGFNNALTYIAAPEFEQAFQVLDYVVVQIDTDIAQEIDVSTHDGGDVIPVPDLVQSVQATLQKRITLPVWERIGDRVIFAIAVSSIECWLLVLHGKDKRDRERTLNCLDHLNKILSKQNKPSINPNAKTNKDYDRLSRDFSKRKTLDKVRAFNPSLDLFIASVDRLQRGA